MKPEEVKKHYKTAYNFYKETGMSPANIGNWVRWGYIPIASQFKIEETTNGKLKANYGDSKK